MEWYTSQSHYGAWERFPTEEKVFIGSTKFIESIVFFLIIRKLLGIRRPLKVRVFIVASSFSSSSVTNLAPVSPVSSSEPQ